jgi:hypothetical protein
MLIGALIPQAHTLTFLIQYLLMAMLFFAFLGMEFKLKTIPKSVILILFANIALAFGGHAILAPFDKEFALVAFITAIAPTTIAAPVITAFVGR